MKKRTKNMLEALILWLASLGFYAHGAWWIFVLMIFIPFSIELIVEWMNDFPQNYSQDRMWVLIAADGCMGLMCYGVWWLIFTVFV